MIIKNVIMCICINERDFIEWILLTIELFAACVTIFSLFSLMPTIREWRYKSQNNKSQKERLKKIIIKNEEVVYYKITGNPNKDYLLIEGKYCWIADETTLIQIRVFFEKYACKLIEREMPKGEKIIEGEYIKLF